MVQAILERYKNHSPKKESDQSFRWIKSQINGKSVEDMKDWYVMLDPGTKIDVDRIAVDLVNDKYGYCKALGVNHANPGEDGIIKMAYAASIILKDLQEYRDQQFS